MDNLFEDLHWLLLISAYLLADESEGETPLIPSVIITYSASLKDQVNVQACLQTLCASQNQALGNVLHHIKIFSCLCGHRIRTSISVLIFFIQKNDYK